MQAPSVEENDDRGSGLGVDAFQGLSSGEEFENSGGEPNAVESSGEEASGEMAIDGTEEGSPHSLETSGESSENDTFLLIEASGEMPEVEAGTKKVNAPFRNAHNTHTTTQKGYTCY